MYDNIPFHDRIVKLKSGYTLIWPYRNIPRRNGPVELVLDTNALIRSNWFAELSAELKQQSVISPFLSLVESWHSNAEFRSHPEAKVSEMLSPFRAQGVSFEKNYESFIAQDLAANEKASRSQWMVGYLFTILLYRIVFAKKTDAFPVEILSTLKHKNVPAFSGCIMLCTLAAFLKKNQSVKLIGDKKTAFSYFENFSSLKPQAKGETNFGEGYVRNRIGDLKVWLDLPMLIQNHYKPAGQPVIVTKDNMLKHLVFRCFPWVLVDDRRMAVSFDERSFEPQVSEEICRLIDANVFMPNPPSEKKDKLERLERLKKTVLEGAAPEIAKATEDIWSEWLKPGFMAPFSVHGER